MLIVTATSLVMRTVRMSFNVYLSGKLGAQGMGLFQLAAAVYFLALTIANAGVRLAVTRLVAEELEQAG